MTTEARFGDLHSAVISELAKAKKTAFIAIAWISFPIYASQLARLAKNGVKIKILCGDNNSNRKQLREIKKLRSEGVEIVLYKMPHSTNHMHHKFAVIDETTVLNGSFNWSVNAVRNFENLMIVRDEPDLVRMFMGEFEKIEALDTAAIKSLQSLGKCERCGGRLTNLLVFDSRPQRMTYEIWGDLVEVCSGCGEDSFKVIKHGVQDPRLYSLLSTPDAFTDDESKIDKYRFDRALDTHLTGYSLDGVLLHGIGIASSELRYPDIESIATHIVWKNKFVEEFVLDRYESDFGVSYQ